MFPPPELPVPGSLLLITDELASPADFLLHQFLAASLKDPNCSRCVILSVSGDIARWKAVAAKSGLNLTQRVDSKDLVFIDVPALVNSSPASLQALGHELRLRAPYDAALAALAHSNTTSAKNGQLLILDDIAALEWTGFSAPALAGFVRALSAACRTSGASLVVRHHIVTPGEPDALLRHLLQCCAHHLDVRPLASGRSGAVSGEIALHAGPAAAVGRGAPDMRLVPRSRAVQYRLTDAGAVFFERGTGGGVL